MWQTGSESTHSKNSHKWSDTTNTLDETRKESFWLSTKIHTDNEGNTDLETTILEKRNLDLWSDSPPDGACGWYSLANIKWRSLYPTELNIQVSEDYRKGAYILHIWTKGGQRLTEVSRGKLTRAQNWIKSDRSSTYSKEDNWISLWLIQPLPPYGSYSGTRWVNVFWTTISGNRG